MMNQVTGVVVQHIRRCQVGKTNKNGKNGINWDTVIYQDSLHAESSEILLLTVMICDGDAWSKHPCSVRCLPTYVQHLYPSPTTTKKT